MTDATLSDEFVTDTMALDLRIERRRLGPAIRAIFDAAEAGHATPTIFTGTRSTRNTR